MATIKEVIAQGGSPQVMQDAVRFPGFPAGINNIQPDYAVGPDALRAGSNIDVYDSGRIRRRHGTTKSVALTGAHSFWSDPKNPNPDTAYYVAGTTMYSLKVVSGALASTAVVTGLANGQRVSYVMVNGDVFWTNSLATGRIRNGVNLPLGVETPARTATLTAGTAGMLYAGRYQVALTFRNSIGEESGADIAVPVVIPADGGSIALTALPVPKNSDVAQICVYCTAANGEALHLVAVIPKASTSYMITGLSTATTILKTQFLQPMPAGSHIAHLNGVLYIAVGNYVYHSEPFRYGLCNLNENFYGFPINVDAILAVPDDVGLKVQDGIYVCADKTYFIVKPGTPEAEQKIVFPFGAVPGTDVYLPNSVDVAWFSPRGQVIATIGGKAKVVTEENYMPGVMTRGASIVREYQGLKQIINTVEQPSTSPLEYTGA